MLEILMEMGLSEEMAENVISAFCEFEKKESEKDEADKKPEIPPMGKAEENIPSKEEFEKMGYLARLELSKSNPKAYERLKNGK